LPVHYSRDLAVGVSIDHREERSDRIPSTFAVRKDGSKDLSRSCQYALPDKALDQLVINYSNNRQF
jgi:hypothetical protein